MPAKLSVKDRPTVTAGLANEVDAVKKYAEPIHAGTRTAPRLARPVRVSEPITRSSPALATTSPSQRPPPERVLVEACQAGSPNITSATPTPRIAPSSWTPT